MTEEDKERFRETSRLTAEVPEIRARALDEFTRTLDAIAAALARRLGRTEDDFAVRTLAGAIIGVIMSASDSLLDASAQADRPTDVIEVFGRIDAALAQLEAGLPV